MVIVICSIFSLCMESNFLGNLQIMELLQGFFLHVLLRWFDGLSRSMTLWVDFSVLILSKYFLDFTSDENEKQCIKSSAAIAVIIMPLKFSMIQRSLYVGKRMTQPFIYFSVVFCLYSALPNRWSMLSNFLVFQISGDISLRSSTFRLLFF